MLDGLPVLRLTKSLDTLCFVLHCKCRVKHTSLHYAQGESCCCPSTSVSSSLHVWDCLCVCVYMRGAHTRTHVCMSMNVLCMCVRILCMRVCVICVHTGKGRTSTSSFAIWDTAFWKIGCSGKCWETAAHMSAQAFILSPLALSKAPRTAPTLHTSSSTALSIRLVRGNYVTDIRMFVHVLVCALCLKCQIT
jgi:hypothetical protein